MDLGQCPKCGAQWTAGFEKCTECGFVAIGAGLSKLPKRVKPKIKKYEEPGSWYPFLRGSLVMSLVYFLAVERPWKDSWSYLRSLTGQPMPIALEGDWDVSRVIRIKAGKALFVDRAAQSAHVSFVGDRITFSFKGGSQASEAVGKYTRSDGTIKIRELNGLGEGWPSSLDVTYSMQDDDTFTANLNGVETIILVRKGKGSEGVMLARFDASNPNAGRAMNSMGGFR